MYNPPMTGTPGSIRAQQKAYESIMQNPARRKIFEDYSNRGFKRVEDMGYDTSDVRNQFNRELNLNL